MAEKLSIDSDIVSWRIAEEASPRTLPGSPVWDELQVNQPGSMGGEAQRRARKYYNSGSQTDKGRITAIKAAANCTVDCTPDGYQRFMQGFLRAVFRDKVDLDVVTVGGTNNEYVVADDGDEYVAGDLLFAKGLEDAVNNGFKVVTSGGDATHVRVTDTGLIDAADPGAGLRGKISKVGREFPLETKAASGVDDANDEFDFATPHSFETGWGPVRLTTTDTLPAGLAVDTDYWIIDRAATSVAFALSKADALAGTDIDITDVGTGTHTVSSPGVIVDDDVNPPRLCFLSYDPADLFAGAGEMIFLGGDTAGTQFAPAANNGHKRIMNMVSGAGGLGAGGYVVLDYSANPSDFEATVAMADSTDGSKTPRIFVGRVLKNEKGSLVRKLWHQIEEQLGAPDDSDESAVQAQYLTGAVPDTASWNFTTAEIITQDFSWVCAGIEFNDSTEGEKSGARPESPNTEDDAFNATSDVAIFHLGRRASSGDLEAPSPLFHDVTDLKVMLKNNVALLTGIRRLVGFDASRGTLELGGTMNGYMVDIADQMEPIYEDEEYEMHIVLAHSNKGFAMSMPRVELWTAGPEVRTGNAVMLPLQFEAHRGRAVHVDMDHMLMLVYFDYLPDAAMPASQL